MRTDTNITHTDCPCGAKINHRVDEPPRRCVICKRKFVSADEVVIVGGKNPPTVVTPKPVQGKMGVNNG